MARLHQINVRLDDAEKARLDAMTGGFKRVLAEIGYDVLAAFLRGFPENQTPVRPASNQALAAMSPEAAQVWASLSVETRQALEAGILGAADPATTSKPSRSHKPRGANG